jgi:hypothetical protein
MSVAPLPPLRLPSLKVRETGPAKSEGECEEQPPSRRSGSARRGEGHGGGAGGEASQQQAASLFFLPDRAPSPPLLDLNDLGDTDTVPQMAAVQEHRPGAGRRAQQAGALHGAANSAQPAQRQGGDAHAQAACPASSAPGCVAQGEVPGLSHAADVLL